MCPYTRWVLCESFCSGEEFQELEKKRNFSCCGCYWSRDLILTNPSRQQSPCVVAKRQPLFLWNLCAPTASIEAWTKPLLPCSIHMNKTFVISSVAYLKSSKEAARISKEVSQQHLNSSVNTAEIHQEQRKAALRKVEIELDEADDIVRHAFLCSNVETHVCSSGVATRSRNPGDSSVCETSIHLPSKTGQSGLDEI